MPILKTECVRNCAGTLFDFVNQRVAACSDLPNFAAGTNTTLTGTGTAADPFRYNAPNATEPVVVAAGNNTTVSGVGTAADPYRVNASATTAINAGSNITITGSGTGGDPYVVNGAAPTAPTVVSAGINTTVTGMGSVGDPYMVNSPLTVTADFGQAVDRQRLATITINNGTPIEIYTPTPLRESVELGQSTAVAVPNDGNPRQLPLNATPTIVGSATVAANAITITVPGMYSLSHRNELITTTSAANANISALIIPRVNGVAVGSAVTAIQDKTPPGPGTGQGYTVNGSFVRFLNVGDTIDFVGQNPAASGLSLTIANVGLSLARVSA